MVSTRRCRGCGYQYTIEEKENQKCPYCNTVLEASLVNSSLDERLFNARNLRRIGHFKEARREYSSVIEINENIKEAHFGLFLCDYGVREYRLSENSVTLCKCTYSGKISAWQNENYLNASQNSLNKPVWEKVVKSVEEQRLFNAKLKANMPDFSVMVICDPENPEDCKIADTIYELMHCKMDIVYPPRTFCKIDNSLWYNCLQTAAKKVIVLVVVSSSASGLSKSRFSDIYRDFLDNDMRAFYQLFPVVPDVECIPKDMFDDPENSNYLEYDPENPDFDEIMDSLISRFKLSGVWDFDGWREFSKTGKYFMSGNTESPVLEAFSLK